MQSEIVEGQSVFMCQRVIKMITPLDSVILDKSV